MNDPYPVAVSTAPRVSRRPIQRRWSLVALLAALAVLAAGCSGSEATSENLVPVNTPAPGVLYVSTGAGAIHMVDAADGSGSVLVPATGDTGPNVVDVAPSLVGGGLNALVQDPSVGFKIDLVDVTTSGLDPIDMDSETLTCLDPHADATSSVVHDAAAGTASGTQFLPVAFAGDGLDSADLALISVACPRWTADRSTVATATPQTPTDPSTIVTVVQTIAGERYEIGFTGCGVTPTSFTPDDAFLAISLTCYSSGWDNSGLYLVPVSDMNEPGDLDTLARIGNGLFGRTSWHPDGDWVAAVHADAIAQQNIAQDLGAQPVGLQLIEIATRQTIDLELVDGADPFSVAWLESPLGN